MRDATLGYTHIPGAFSVTLRDGYTFRITHGADNLRITQPSSTRASGAPRPGIWILGCSLTYGWSLNDHETYPWQLQAALPGYEVRNFGVNGYGTVHALLQMRAALSRDRPPAVAIVAYGGFHDERNTFLRRFRKVVVPWNRLGILEQPCARLDRDGTLSDRLVRAEYRELPLMRKLALAHFLETTYNGLEDRYYRSHDVSRALVQALAELARQHRVRLVVAGIVDDEQTRDMLRFAANRGIPAVDISTDLDAPGFRSLPHDTHPSARANEVFAARLRAFLESRILSDAPR